MLVKKAAQRAHGGRNGHGPNISSDSNVLVLNQKIFVSKNLNKSQNFGR